MAGGLALLADAGHLPDLLAQGLAATRKPSLVKVHPRRGQLGVSGPIRIVGWLCFWIR